MKTRPDAPPVTWITVEKLQDLTEELETLRECAGVTEAKATLDHARHVRQELERQLAEAETELEAIRLERDTFRSEFEKAQAEGAVVLDALRGMWHEFAYWEGKGEMHDGGVPALEGCKAVLDDQPWAAAMLLARLDGLVEQLSALERAQTRICEFCKSARREP
jgi:hypothetical protein